MSFFIQVREDFCKKVLRFPTNAANTTAKWEIGREGRRGSLSHLAVKYCFEMMQMGQEELVRSRLRVEGRKFEFGKLDSVVKGRIAQNLFGKYVVDRQEKNSKTVYDTIKTTTFKRRGI